VENTGITGCEEVGFVASTYTLYFLIDIVIFLLLYSHLLLLLDSVLSRATVCLFICLPVCLPSTAFIVFMRVCVYLSTRMHLYLSYIKTIFGDPRAKAKTNSKELLHNVIHVSLLKTIQNSKTWVFGPPQKNCIRQRMCSPERWKAVGGNLF